MKQLAKPATFVNLSVLAACTALFLFLDFGRGNPFVKKDEVPQPSSQQDAAPTVKELDAVVEVTSLLIDKAKHPIKPQ